MRRRRAAFALAGLLCSAATGCTSGSADDPGTSTTTTTRTVTNTRPAAPSGPLATGPTSAAAASSCPFLSKQSAADKVGMRLARITVLTSGGNPVGCRFYALQGSPLSQSEHLPGPKQPAVEILSTRYRSDLGAHNALVRLAQQQGTNVQQASIVGQAPGACFQTAFYPHDRGKDWACAFSKGMIMVFVRTVVTTPALNAILVSRAIAAKF
jgi:hypothetical protein